MESTNESHEIARAVANKMLIEIGRTVVRANQDRAARRNLMRFYQLKKRGDGYDRDTKRADNRECDLHADIPERL